MVRIPPERKTLPQHKLRLWQAAMEPAPEGMVRTVTAGAECLERARSESWFGRSLLGVMENSNRIMKANEHDGDSVVFVGKGRA